MNLSKVYLKPDMKSKRKRYNAKVMHGHYQKKLKQDPGMDKPLSFLLKKVCYIIPECKNYLLATQDKSFLQNTCYTNKP